VPTKVDPIKIIEQVTLGLTKFNTMMPLLGMAFAVVYSTWKKANPDATFEDFNAYLLKESSGVVAFGVEQMLAWGYVRDADGNWTQK
jgi:hypothetical protein